jgi:hypothetical protein
LRFEKSSLELGSASEGLGGLRRAWKRLGLGGEGRLRMAWEGLGGLGRGLGGLGRGRCVGGLGRALGKVWEGFVGNDKTSGPPSKKAFPRNFKVIASCFRRVQKTQIPN